MSGISVIRNNAAPFLFRTIPIPSVHDAGWHVRVYEASRTVKKRCPVVSEKAPMSSGALPSADTRNGNSLITLIFIIPQRPSGRFSPSPRQRNLPEVGKNGNHQERDSAMPGEITPSHSCRYRKSMGHEGLPPAQRLDNLHDRPSFAYISSSAQVTMSTLRSKKDYSILS